MTEKSRRFTVVDVPDPVKIQAEFVYNFFTQDERTNSKGDMRVPGLSSNKSTQKLIDAGTLQTEVPRYVTINFEPAQIVEFNNFGDANNVLDLTQFTNDITAEESITNDAFASSRESDPDASKRLTEKIKALSLFLDIDFEESNQSEKLAAMLGVKRDLIQKLISPYNDPSELKVNSKSNLPTLDLYEIATSLSLNSLINKRVLGIATLGGDDTSPLSRTDDKSLGKQIADKFLLTANASDLTVADFEPTLIPFEVSEDEESEGEPRLAGASTVGYLLIRKQLSPSSRVIETRVFPISGKENISYIDSRVIYGSKYMYSVRAVYRIDAVVSSSDLGQEQKLRIATLIASRPTSSVSVLTEEFDPPSFPDGVFYNYNYSRSRGLIITWQVPAGRARDVKYFQVFRRASIYEPFQCIAEIDFDDSDVKTLKSEQVRNDLVHKSNGPQTMFEDRVFNRDHAGFIYTVCAVDAHGMTSGYSTQTLVGFDKTKNILTLKNISPPGAPKQYPNFFIDPDLDDNIAVDNFSQDAIFDSGHTRMDVYFTPDALSATTKTGAEIDVLVTDRNQGVYQVHILNLDLQKSTTAEIQVKDLRKV